MLVTEGGLCDPLQQRMREELVRCDFFASTFRTYLSAVEAFQSWAGKRLEELGPDKIRRRHGYLLEGRKLAKTTVVTHISALRFLWVGLF